MKRIFKLSASGYGHALIVKRFQAEGVAPFKGAHWSRTYIALILKDRRALGGFQPRLRNGDKAGAVIKDYYPAVVTEDEWDATRNGVRQRKTRAVSTSATPTSAPPAVARQPRSGCHPRSSAG
jgi:hypothetical protein